MASFKTDMHCQLALGLRIGKEQNKFGEDEATSRQAAYEVVEFLARGRMRKSARLFPTTAPTWTDG